MGRRTIRTVNRNSFLYSGGKISGQAWQMSESQCAGCVGCDKDIFPQLHGTFWKELICAKSALEAALPRGGVFISQLKDPIHEWT